MRGDNDDSIEDAVIAAQLPQRCDSKGPEPEVVSVGIVSQADAIAAKERELNKTQNFLWEARLRRASHKKGSDLLNP